MDSEGFDTTELDTADNGLVMEVGSLEDCISAAMDDLEMTPVWYSRGSNAGGATSEAMSVQCPPVALGGERENSERIKRQASMKRLRRDTRTKTQISRSKLNMKQ